jgi:hypothetical protein
METCIKTNKETIMGMQYRSKCERPVYENGLCKKHYDRAIEKSKNWIQRKNYAPATLDQLKSGRSLKLKNSNMNILFRGHKGIIQIWSKHSEEWTNTDLKFEPDEFCIKTI